MAKSEPMGIADGEDVAQGSTTDSSGASTVIGQLKAIAGSLAGALSTVIRGGAKGTTTAADLTGTNISANHQALDVTIWGTGGNEAAVKAASTAVAAADPSLAVGLSPNSPLPAGTNALGSVKGTVEDSATGAQVLSAAPGSDTGQRAVAVRVISQLGAGSGGGGGAVTIADGADVAQGTTTDASSANTVVGILKAIKAAVQGTLTADITDRAARLLGHVTVDNASIAVTGPLTDAQLRASAPAVDTELPAASTLADAEANPSTTRAAAYGYVWNGATWDRAPGSAASGAKVQSAQLPAALDGSGFLKVHEQGVAHVDDNSGSLTVDAPVGTPVFARLSDGAAALIGQKTMAASLPVALASDETPLQVVGNVANAAADSGNPVKTGGKATWPAVPTLVATGQRVDAYADLAGATIIRKRPLASYTASYRLADATAAARHLSKVMVANTDVQIATIYHAGSATKRVQIKYVALYITGNSVAATIEVEIQPLSATTAPATGNPAITPGKSDPADGAAEATCLALPTTAGSLVGVNSPVGIPFAQAFGIIAADTNTRAGTPIVLWDSRGDTDGKDLIIRAALAEGYAINLRANAASTINFEAVIIFTEE